MERRGGEQRTTNVNTEHAKGLSGGGWGSTREEAGGAR